MDGRHAEPQLSRRQRVNGELSRPHSNAEIKRAACAAPSSRHCEEQSDEAIQFFLCNLDCFASLAMTK
ncbi:MAG: hypothetical protein EKK40_18615 [Bradyrhizobiaceae bacterium]|nr:MAG: hypothetical protein EKK40_18615 [Bradyrhizobiaceae bacterium]